MSKFVSRCAVALISAIGLGSSAAQAELIYVSLSDSTIVTYDVSLSSAAAVRNSRTVFASGSPLNAPEEMVFDSQGNLYTTNRNGNTVTKITAAGVKTTFASGAASLLNKPIGLAIDQFDNLYVSNENGATITKLTQGGVASTFASNIGSYGLAADALGNIYAASGNTIMRYDQSGVGSTFATFSSAAAGGMRGMGFDGAGNLFAACFATHDIFKFTTSGVASTVFNTAGVGPNDVTFDSLGNYYVAANGTRRVQKYNAAGVFQFEWDMGGPRSQHLLMQPGVIPAPGAIALLGLAGLAGRRRR
jgi:hypothetical protein